MRSLVFMLAFLLLLVGCRSGSIEAVQVDNPDVTAAPVPTRTPPTAVPEVEPTTTTETNNSAGPDATPPPADETSSDDADGESDGTPADGEEPTDSDAQTGTATDEPETDELADDDPATDETEDGAGDAVVDPDELLTLDVGAVAVDPTDPWCVVADQVNDNYRAVSAVDQADPLYLEAVFRQTYESVEVAAQVAPAEIANEAEIERWLWQQVVEVHAEANWVITSVDFARVSELGDANSGALQSVDDYTSSTCG